VLLSVGPLCEQTKEICYAEVTAIVGLGLALVDSNIAAAQDYYYGRGYRYQGNQFLNYQGYRANGQRFYERAMGYLDAAGVNKRAARS